MDSILGMSRDGILELEHEDIGDRDLTTGEVTYIFEESDSAWFHSGDPTAPHAELTSGKCSDGFVNVLTALRYTRLCLIFALQLIRKVRKNYDGRIDWVIGSDHAGAALSHSVATAFGCQHDFAEKGPDKTQLWNRFTIKEGEVVLQVEELMTTAGTLNAVRDGIRRGNSVQPVTFAPLVATLVHRSDVTGIDGAPVVYLAHYDIKPWEPADCPLCRGGSKRLRPKHHWAELTGKTA